jgi:hypothetical protein
VLFLKARHWKISPKEFVVAETSSHVGEKRGGGDGMFTIIVYKIQRPEEYSWFVPYRALLHVNT